MPKLVRIFFICDAIVILLYIVNELAGSPWKYPANFVDMDSEKNLPAWYSSMQICLAGLFLFLAAEGIRKRTRGSNPRTVYILAFLFFLFSLDEVAGIHEWLGGLTDVFLPGADRANTILDVTGIWMFVIGIPVILFVAWLVLALRPYLGEPRVFRLFVIGFLLFFGGSVGVEFLSNINYRPWVVFLQVITEEAGEMFGMTTILWGTWELLRRHRPTIVIS